MKILKESINSDCKKKHKGFLTLISLGVHENLLFHVFSFLRQSLFLGVCRFQVDEGKHTVISKRKQHRCKILNVNPFHDLMPWDSNHKHLQREWVSKIIQRASLPMSYREVFLFARSLVLFFENLITGKHKLQLPY